jgi:hypothetical protein
MILVPAVPDGLWSQAVPAKNEMVLELQRPLISNVGSRTVTSVLCPRFKASSPTLLTAILSDETERFAADHEGKQGIVNQQPEPGHSFSVESSSDRIAGNSFFKKAIRGRRLRSDASSPQL